MAGRIKKPNYASGPTALGGRGNTIIDTNKVAFIPKPSRKKAVLEQASARCIVTAANKARVSLAPVPCLKRPIP